MAEEPTTNPPQGDSANAGGDTPGNDSQDRSSWVPPGRLKEEAEKRRSLENELAEIRKTQDDATAKKLEEDGKLKEALDLKTAKMQELETDFAGFKMDTILRRSIAAKVNIPDAAQKDANVELLFKGLNRKAVSVNNDGTLAGIDEEIGRLKTAHATLFGNDEPGVRPPENPNATTTAARPGAGQVKDLPFKTKEEVWNLPQAEFLKLAKSKGLLH